MTSNKREAIKTQLIGSVIGWAVAEIILWLLTGDSHKGIGIGGYFCFLGGYYLRHILNYRKEGNDTEKL